MQQALDLAATAQGWTSPNPMVGCVVVRDGQVVGTGYHPKPGEPHAEVFALREAGEQARGADLYVTLEPCSHFGRTPPCTEAIKSAGVVRVVCAMLDPDPRVNGRGVRILREAGISVETGVKERESRRLNEQYIHHRVTGRSWVTVKWAQTLDGRVATASGHSKWVTGPEARQEGHRLRSVHDGVLVGIGTVLADDPQLNVRLDDDNVPQPRHIVLDSHLRLKPDARLIAPGETIVFCAHDIPEERRKPLEDVGAEIIAVPSNDTGLNLGEVLRILGERSFLGVYVEGGPTVVTSFLRQELVNRVVTFIAPSILGTGTDAVGNLGMETMDNAIRLVDVEMKQVGVDSMLTGLVGEEECSPV